MGEWKDGVNLLMRSRRGSPVAYRGRLGGRAARKLSASLQAQIAPPKLDISGDCHRKFLTGRPSRHRTFLFDLKIDYAASVPDARLNVDPVFVRHVRLALNDDDSLAELAPL